MISHRITKQTEKDIRYLTDNFGILLLFYLTPEKRLGYDWIHERNPRRKS